MYCLPSRRQALPFVFALVAVASGAGTEAQAQQAAKPAKVVAVEKALPSVVAVRLPKAGGKKDTVGTGVIIHTDGVVVTNRHVVGTYKSVYVRLHDGREFVAKVLYANPNDDLALLHIQGEGTKFPPMTLDPVEHLWQNEEVIAIGHPYGYMFSVTKGVISFVGREITMPTGEVLTGLIQLDAPINPGNSGGPLLNEQGQLIGINVALRDGAQGIAFAINVQSVRNFVVKHIGAEWLTVSQPKAPAAAPIQVAAPNQAASKPGPVQKAVGQAKDAAPKGKLTKIEEPAPAAAPAAHEETKAEPQSEPAQKCEMPAPVVPVSSSTSHPPSAPVNHFGGATQTEDSSAKLLTVALICMLVVVASQQFLLIRRGTQQPACVPQH